MASEKWFRHPVPKAVQPRRQRRFRWKLIAAAAALSVVLAAALVLLQFSPPPQALPEVRKAQPIGVAKADRELGEGLVELPPMERFTEYAVGHAYRPAQDALNRGEITYAVVLFGRRNSIARPDTDRECRFGIALQRAYDETAGRVPEARECRNGQPIAHGHR